MDICSRQEFIDYCRSRGADEFKGGDSCSCAMTQFMQTKNPDVRRSFINGDSFYRIGGDYGKQLVGLDITAEEAVQVVICSTFDQVVSVLTTVRYKLW